MASSLALTGSLPPISWPQIWAIYKGKPKIYCIVCGQYTKRRKLHKCVKQFVMMQKQIQLAKGQIFLDLSLGGSPAGRLMIQLNNRFPELKAFMIENFSMAQDAGVEEGTIGPFGKMSMDLCHWVTQNTLHAYFWRVFASPEYPRIISLPEINESRHAERGDVLTGLPYFRDEIDMQGHHLNSLLLQVGEFDYYDSSHYWVVGRIQPSGMAILDNCCDDINKGLKITKLGLT